GRCRPRRARVASGSNKNAALDERSPRGGRELADCFQDGTFCAQCCHPEPAVPGEIDCYGKKQAIVRSLHEFPGRSAGKLCCASAIDGGGRAKHLHESPAC